MQDASQRSFSVWQRALTSAFAILFVCTSITAPALAAAVALEVEPIVRIHHGGVAACGLKVTARSDNTIFHVEIFNDKTSQGTRTTLRVTATDRPGVTGARLKSRAHDTDTLLHPSGPRSEQGFAASAHLAPDTIGPLFRDLLVTGFDLTVTTTAKTYSWQKPGPVPHSVRQLYLMCSGDLYRP